MLFFVYECNLYYLKDSETNLYSQRMEAYQRNPLTIVMSKYLTIIFISSCSLLEVECIRINLAANNQKPAKYLSSKDI